MRKIPQEHAARLLFSSLVMLFIFVIDSQVPLGIAGAVPYIAVILMTMPLPGSGYSIGFGIACSLLTIFGFFLSPAGGEWVNVLSNRALALFAIWITVFLSLRNNRSLQLLAGSEERFRLVVESAANGLIMVNGEGRIELVNTRAEEYFGYEREELLGCSVEMLVPHRFRDRHPALRRQFASERHARPMGGELELFGLRKDGSEFPLEIGLSPITTPEGERVLTSIVDVTERRQYEERLKRYADELKRSNTELEQFAYVASHDLQEPLRKIGSFTQLLELEYGEKLEGDATEYLRVIIRSATRMRQLINDLLNFSRVGRVVNPEQKISGEDLLREVLSNLEPAIREHAATVRYERFPRLCGNRTHLLQLFQNLVGNALKFHGEHPVEVDLSVTEENGFGKFCVRDNGIGIEPEFKEQIFVIFKRLHARHEYPGTGIGLAMCKKIVEHHGGNIWVESEPGQGSSFYFTLPVAKED